MAAGTALDPADSCQERLLRANRGLRAALLGYRDGARVFSGSRFTGTEHAPAQEASLRLLTLGRLSSSPRPSTRAVRPTRTPSVSPSRNRRCSPSRASAGRGDDVDERARRLAEYPLAAEAGMLLFVGYDEQFEEGLALVIAGIGARYGIGWPISRPAGVWPRARCGSPE